MCSVAVNRKKNSFSFLFGDGYLNEVDEERKRKADMINPPYYLEYCSGALNSLSFSLCTKKGLS